MDDDGLIAGDSNPSLQRGGELALDLSRRGGDLVLDLSCRGNQCLFVGPGLDLGGE